MRRFVVALSALLTGCVLDGGAEGGALKVVNQTTWDANLEWRPCGQDEWIEDGIVAAGSSRLWKFDRDECRDLQAWNAQLFVWEARAEVEPGRRVIVWIEWESPWD